MLIWTLLLLALVIIFAVYGTLPDRGCVPAGGGMCLSLTYEQDFGPPVAFWLTAGRSSAKKKASGAEDEEQTTPNGAN
jgi:hypothetical protein